MSLPTRYSAFAVTAPGLAVIAANELLSLGLAPGVPESGGVPMTLDLAGVYRANLQLRTASRVILRLDEFRAATFHELTKRSARIPWPEWLAQRCAVALRVTCRKSRLYHSDAVAERIAEVLQRAVGATSLRDAEEGGRKGEDSEGGDADGKHAQPQPNEEEAQLIIVRLVHDRCTISIDTSGALLHLRGYRQAVAKAPLRETIGAAILLGTPWDPRSPLIDPFCGSGTIPIEAARFARRMAPGRDRRFAFERWPTFDAPLWRETLARARDAELAHALAPIVGSDRDDGAILAARANADRAGVAGDIDFVRRSASAIERLSGSGDGLGAVVTNPPYGVRIQERGDLRNLYARFGDAFRAQLPGWRLGVLSPDPRLTGQLGLALEERLVTSNGGIDVRLLVHAGSAR